MRVYLDNCTFNRPYDDQTQLKVSLETQSKLHIQNLIKEGRLDLVGSYTLDYEISKNPFEMRRKSITKFLQDNMKAYVGVERDDVISASAEEIMNSGVKEKDAFHVASAIYAECEFFISTDIRLLKYKSEKIFDYTKWQRQYFDEMEPGEFHDKAVEYGRNHPYTGKAERL